MSAPMSETRRRQVHGPIVPMEPSRPRIAPVNLLTLAALPWIAIGLIAWWLA